MNDRLLRLTHWGRVTHICVSKLTIIGSDNGLAPGRRQTIIWTNDGILLIGPLGTNFSEILIEMLTFSFMKMHLKVSSAKRRPFCLGLNVLIRRFFAGMHVPRCHVNKTLSDTIFLCEYQRFACWLKNIFWIRVQKFMLPIHIVLEICGLKVVVSFNFALSAPHVKRRVKSCEPRAAVANKGLLSLDYFHATSSLKNIQHCNIKRDLCCATLPHGEIFY